MAEFTPIMTQEDFDKAISDRIKREKKAAEDKYSGYLSPEDVAKKYEGYLSPADVEEKYKDHLSPEKAAELDKKIKGYESASVKTRIALEMGLPYEIAGRLSGEDEAAIRKDAETMVKLLGGANKVPPLRSTETGGADNENAAYKAMLSNLKGE